MTLLDFAGRTTLRRLHHTVQRNLSRQQRVRFESTKPAPSSKPSTTANSEAPKQRTIPGPTWAWIEPLLAPARGYSNMQRRSPLLTQWESTLVIYFLGDLSAQVAGTNVFVDGQYEPIRGLRALIIGSIISIPSYKWFLFLGNHFNYKSHALSIAVKIVVNQMVFTPLFNTYFFGANSLLAGSTLEEARRRVMDTVPISFVNSWKVWPAVTAFSFTFVQPQYRSVFAGVIAIFWQTYLSWLNKQAESSEAVVEPVKQAVEKVKKATAKAVGG